ncbi:unnamed protein product [Ectocarpus sp. CCAP 1310/34]|nr:unnamed protein product [Ectocarpus sp. CCAP 1310/34]
MRRDRRPVVSSARYTADKMMVEPKHLLVAMMAVLSIGHASGQCASALYVFWGPCTNSTCESAQLYFPIQWEADCVASNPIVTVDFTAPIVNSGVASATIEGNLTTVYGEVSDDQLSVTFGMGESGVDPSSYDSGWSGFLVSLDNCDTSYTWSDNFFEVSYVDDEQNTIDLSAFEDPDIEIPDTGICPTPSPVTPSPATLAPGTAASPTEAGSSLALGCYEDDPEDRIMDNLALSDSSMTTEVNRRCFRVPEDISPHTCCFIKSSNEKDYKLLHVGLALWSSFPRLYRNLPCRLRQPVFSTEPPTPLFCLRYLHLIPRTRAQCWCGSSDADYALHGESTGCTYACSGDSAQTCGGYNAANVYLYPVDSTPSPTPSPTEEDSSLALGCYGDDPEARIMDELVLSDSSMTTECWCGSAGADYAVHGESTDCTYACSGDTDQTCGGFDAANVYRYPDGSTPNPTPSPTEAASFVALGCYEDDREDRIMDELVLSDPSMTTELCELTCLGNTYFATQYGSECWCGSAGADYAVHGESTICTYACSGDADQTCGGYDAANVYRYTAEGTPSPTPSPTEAGSHLALGCYEDDREARIMDELVLSDSSMTTECWCGSAGADYALHGESTDCTYPCAGDADQMCGGFDAANVYRYTDGSTPSPTPSPTEAGSHLALGCYEDDREDRIMDELVLSDSSMTTELCELTCVGSTYFATQYGQEMCEAECTGNTYFGMQYGTECFCGGESTDLLQHGESTACNYECPGDSDQVCGGFYAMSVYSYS